MNNDFENNPLMRTLNNLLGLAKGMLFIVGIILIFWSIPYYRKRWKRADSVWERRYWMCNFVSSCCMAYAFLIFMLVAFDNMFFHMGVENWWPSFTWIFSSQDHATSVALDMLWIGLFGGCLMPVSGIFGHSVDDRYYPPEWVDNFQTVEYLEQLIAKHKLNNPSLGPNWGKFTVDQRAVQRTKWRYDLAALEQLLEDKKRSVNKPVVDD